MRANSSKSGPPRAASCAATDVAPRTTNAAAARDTKLGKRIVAFCVTPNVSVSGAVRLPRPLHRMVGLQCASRSLLLRCSTANGPGARDQFDGAVACYRKLGPDPVPQGAAPLFVQRHRVSRGRCLAAEKRRPIVVEIAESGGNIIRADLDVTQSSLCKQRGQGTWLAKRKPAPFVQLKGGSIQFDRCIPEVAHQLHFPGVIPDVSSHHTARPYRTCHFTNRKRWFWHEIQNQTCDSSVKTCGFQW